LGIQPLDGGVEIEQQCALAIVPHHALDPEKMMTAATLASPA
jgi:hypothetical protein